MTDINLCQGDIELLKAIAADIAYDTANHNDSQRRSARFLYNNELIEACPIEDSDANVEALSITGLGKAILRKLDSEELGRAERAGRERASRNGGNANCW